MRRLVFVLAAACSDAEPETTAPGPQIEPRAQQATRAQRPAEEKPGYLGTLVPRGLAEVISPFTSTVTSLEVKLGDRVEKGQVLARLDERPLREELAIAKAMLKASKASVGQAAIERKAAEAALDRERRALKENVASKADVSAADFNQRKASMNVARASANADEQRARIAQLEARLKDTTLRAPIDGRVALMYGRAGDRIEEGHSVIRVISSDELFVKFAIPADHVGTLAPDDHVDILIGQISTPGVIRHVAPEIDPIAKMILADADLTEPPPNLQSGIDCRIVPRVKP